MKDLVVNKPLVAAFKARHKMTDEDIAKKLRVPYSSWVRWLNGKNAIPVGALLALSDLVGMDSRDLVCPAEELAADVSHDRTAEGLLRRAGLIGSQPSEGTLTA